MAGLAFFEKREKVKPLGIHTAIGHLHSSGGWQGIDYLKDNDGLMPPFIIAVGSRTRVESAVDVLGLKNPVFDVHYNARIGGRNAQAADKIPYALVITISSKNTAGLYNRILQRYPTILEPLKPVVEIPIRT